jgi:adenosylcobinamide-phosphate synthase
MIDRTFGEFSFIRHPVIIMGDYIKWFEKRFYKDTIFNGAVLTITLTLIVYSLAHALTLSLGDSYISIVILSIITSTTIASKMLYDSVKDIIQNPHHIRYLVSRDTENLSSSDINKATIETYAENLSDGVIAPLFYLLIFGVEGAFIYKAINTLDSMVGYRNPRYEKFGKFSAIVDDIANYIPSRITAIFIALLFFSKNALLKFYSFGKKHKSPNAGHPISAMALSIGVKLGGDTAYFGKMISKPYFGEGKKEISTSDIDKSLSLQVRLDILLIIILGILLWV